MSARAGGYFKETGDRRFVTAATAKMREGANTGINPAGNAGLTPILRLRCLIRRYYATVAHDGNWRKRMFRAAVLRKRTLDLLGFGAGLRNCNVQVL